MIERVRFGFKRKIEPTEEESKISRDILKRIPLSEILKEGFGTFGRNQT